jgi:hypothetical protein
VQGPAIKRSGFRFIHEAKRTITTYSTVASWGADVRADNTKFVLNGQDLAGKDAVGILRWAQKFVTTTTPGTPLSITLGVNVEGISTVIAGFDVGRYGANGQDDPQADSAATMFSRCANAAEYLNDNALMSTTGAKQLPLGNTAVSDWLAARTASATFSVSARYADEAAAQPTGSWISEHNEGANAPTLNVTVLEDTAKDPVRLIPFEFSTEQAYILEFGKGYMRVMKDGGVVLESTKAISATTNATPVVVTTATHGYADGDEVFITGTGVAAIDGKYWYIKVLTTTTFQLLGSTAPGSTSATGTSARVYTLTTPYEVSGDVSALSFAQSADTLYIAHPNYPPAKVTRTGHASWTHTQISFDYFPFAPENRDEAITVSANNNTGAITLVSSSPIFTSDMVGSYMKLRDIPESHNAPWAEQTDFNPGGEDPYTEFIAGGGSAAVGDRVHNDGKVYSLEDLNGRPRTGKVPPTHETGTEPDGSWSWTFVNYGYGYAQITGFTSTTQVNATVIKALPKTITSVTFGTFRWSFGAWSESSGYPNSVVFFEDRLIWGGPADNPDTFFCSRTGRYEDHRATDEDDSAMVLTLNSGQVNSIQWMVAQSVLQIGTTGGEWASKESDDPLTPINVGARIKQRSTYGSRSVAPAAVENVVLFVQRSGRKLRELTPPSSLDSSTEEAPDMTLLAEDYTTGILSALAFQSEPSRVLWAIMEDGGLYGFTYEKSQQVTGWHRHPLGGDGAVESIAVIPHPDGDKDQLWAVVRRSIGGVTRRYLEALDPQWMPGDAIANAFFVDSGLTYSGSAATTISGLGHLEGQTVAVLADGMYVGTQTVSSGAITLTTAASTVQVGLPYSATLETLRLEAGSGDGVAQGDTKRIGTVVLRIYQTGKGLFLAPSSEDIDAGVRTSEVTVLEDFQPGQSVEMVEGGLYGGDTRPIPFPGGYEQKGRIALRHSTPLPCTLTAIFPTLVNQDR